MNMKHQPLAPAEWTDAQREAARDALSAELGSAMDCTRMWSAWGVGTMSEDDFQLLADNDERLDDLVGVVEAAILAATTQASTAQDERVPEGWKLVPVEPTPEIIAAAAIAAWPTASAADIALAQKAARIVLMQMDSAPGITADILAATLATMAPAYRAMLAASPSAPLTATSSTDAQAAAEVREAWISVDERLPEMYQTVALLDEKRWMNTGSRDHNVNWHGSGYLCEFGGKYWSIFGEMRSQCLDAVTHWMPLPAAPKRAGDTGEQADGGAA